ncbi:alpha/beta-hydrolase [Massarina eburnea CBS 473.64]|uniref:Alpha/beta-hydrolase n=1 Tax=Massarina eburnea CBS 473.64 TaxID=1395130 RepID=A0A6A6S5X9_9PLEO|nr:alpha/beta-hydrolase [Massarina eburnea CBS 473.64]
MVFISSLIYTFLLACSTFALPTVPIGKRSIDDKLFTNLQLMEQYASAAYCRNNQNSPGDKVSCNSGTCDLVQKANVTSVIEYASELATDVTGFVSLDATNKMIVITFRGTASIDNWITDLTFKTVDTNLCEGCTAHAGFWQSWQDSRKEVLASVERLSNANPTFKIVTTGHSLGGAIATIAAADLRNLKYNVDLYTYGAPRIADSTLSSYITKQGNNYRVTHYNDIVPQVPPMFMDFVHISPEYYIETHNFKSVDAGNIKVLEGEKNTNGNAGHMLPDVLAHLWYFNGISNCQLTSKQKI